MLRDLSLKRNIRTFSVMSESIATDHARLYYQIDCEEKELPGNSLCFQAQFRRVE